ncbi:MAG: tetratricopeptide repeat protein [bacterium]|nr:tetratricopeptide repeat protein [bacterium]
MIRVLLLLKAAFSAWMFYDAIHRRTETYWFFIIWLPFGEILYFFLVKINDPEFFAIRKMLDFPRPKRISIDKIRYQFQQTPSFANMVLLAQALHDRGEYQEAAELFTQALKIDSSSPEALLGLSLTEIGLEEYETAVEHLQMLTDVNPQYDGYSAWPNLAYALWMAGRHDESVAALAGLVRTNPRPNHRLLYADYLAQANQVDAARQQISIVLEDYTHSSPSQKRRNRASYRQATKMLKQLDSAASQF